MGQGGFPLDLVLFGLIAAFLILRLRSVLGRRTGYERPPVDPRTRPEAVRQAPVIDGHAEPAPTPTRPMPDPNSPIGAALRRMRDVDHDFDPERFLAGAESAFRIIVEAFAKPDRDALRPLLSEETFRSFEVAIGEREKRGETQKSEIRAIKGATIEAAELSGTSARITVRFDSEQRNVTLGSDGEPVSGMDAISEINDIWTFERDLAAADPTWRLVDARSA